MPKITDVAKIPGAAAPAAGSNIFKEINAVINNLKDGMRMVRELQGLGDNPPAPSPEPSPGGRALKTREKERPAPAQIPPPAAPGPPAPAGGFDLKKALAFAIALGWQDKTLKEVAELLGDLTVAQAAELMQNAGHRK